MISKNTFIISEIKINGHTLYFWFAFAHPLAEFLLVIQSLQSLLIMINPKSEIKHSTSKSCQC